MIKNKLIMVISSIMILSNLSLSVLAQDNSITIQQTPNIEKKFQSTLAYKQLPSIQIDESSMFVSPLETDNSNNNNNLTDEEINKKEEDVKNRLNKIEELIHAREKLINSQTNTTPEDIAMSNPDVITKTSTDSGPDFEIVGLPENNSTFDILSWDIETRTSPIKDWSSNPENKGLQEHVARFKEEVAAKYGVTSFSLYRPGDPQDHGKGLAIDFMVPVGSQVGDDIASYALTKMYDGSERISYIIWEQHIWGDWSSGWEAMEDRGSITQNHYDHVHVSFYP